MLVSPINLGTTNLQKQKLKKNNVTQSTNQNISLPAFADAKSFVNISFRGVCGAVNGKSADYDRLCRELNSDNVNSTDEGYTPLIWLVGCSDNENLYKCMERILEEDNVDINYLGKRESNENEFTAIMRAAYCKKSRAVQMLLDREDIDLTIKNHYGKTVVDYAQEELNGSLVREIKEKFDYQLAHPETIGKKRILAVDINKLSPEENIWTTEQISKAFLSLVRRKEYSKAAQMLQNTPLIYMDTELLDTVCTTGNSSFARKVFDYVFHKQQPMREEYDTKRKDFLENKIKTMNYEELKKSNVALYTLDGYKMLMEKEEFNPNDVPDKESLFDIACQLDPEGHLAHDLLSVYDDIKVDKWLTSKNVKVKTLVDSYNKTDKYKLRLENIKRDLLNPAGRDAAIEKLKNFINSDEFKPEMTDTLGNSALHIVSKIADDDTRTLIQKLINKGVDVNAQNVTSQSPIMSAISALRAAGNEDDKTRILSNIKFLIDKGANLDDADANGQTVFHYVCSTVSVALLTLILSKEPNVLARDLKGNRGHIYLKTPEMKEIYERYLRS